MVSVSPVSPRPHSVFASVQKYILYGYMQCVPALVSTHQWESSKDDLRPMRGFHLYGMSHATAWTSQVLTLLVCIGRGAEFSQGLILVAWSYNRHDSFHWRQTFLFWMLFGFLLCHVVYESRIEKATNAAAQNNECDEKKLWLNCIKASLLGEILFKSPSPIQCCKGSIFNWKCSHQRTVSRVNFPRCQISHEK